MYPRNRLLGVDSETEGASTSVAEATGGLAAATTTGTRGEELVAGSDEVFDDLKATSPTGQLSRSTAINNVSSTVGPGIEPSRETSANTSTTPRIIELDTEVSWILHFFCLQKIAFNTNTQ
ncbi:unnamed protein product [Protopolystoma xenopodis]|uniref:Uncharacterized protein n=1 Tax=Protopolystoma xenopodis TaxID=117903 RepID=A0A3S5ABQ1_9PLAT|nr:unnamed protein product [Protopolystoma xenopodis]